MNISVVPTPVEITIPMICQFNFSVYNFQLGKEITFNVILIDQNGAPLSMKQITLSGDDYTAWGKDESYVVNYICKSLGLSLQT